jgi:replication-associated recombination protein RarA
MSASIPKTKNGLDAGACISALQKCIRRGMEREAMQFAVELAHSSKPFLGWVLARLEIIVHEDCDVLAAPWLIAIVHAACEQSRAKAKSVPADRWECPGEARLMVGNIVRLLCSAKKSRAGCHFAAAIGLREMLQHFVPEIPDWALDQHTPAGKARGRGIDHFRQEGAKLVPPAEPDEYEGEAYRLWELKAGRRR